MRTDKSPFESLVPYGEFVQLKVAARLEAKTNGERLSLHYDSDATPCGCVLTTELGGIPATIVIGRKLNDQTALRCYWCKCEWLEPQPPYRGLDPGPRGFEVIRQGDAA